MRTITTHCVSTANLVLAALLTIALTCCSLDNRLEAVSVAPDFYETNVLADSPEVYWRLGEGSTASPADNLGTQGTAADGAYGSTTTLGVSGALFDSTNTAAGFTGGVNTTSNVTESAFAFPSGDFSSEFWVNTSTQGATQGLVSYNSPGRENDFLVIIANTNLITVLLANSPAATLFTGVDVTDGDWHHIVTTWDSTAKDFVIYDNGVSAFSASSVVANAGRNPLGDLVLGQEQDGTGASGTYTTDPNQAFTGSLDEFALYGHVLSPEEVLLHYNIGVGNVLPPVPEPSSFLLLGLGALGLVRHTRRRRRIATAR